MASTRPPRAAADPVAADPIVAPPRPTADRHRRASVPGRQPVASRWRRRPRRSARLGSVALVGLGLLAACTSTDDEVPDRLSSRSVAVPGEVAGDSTLSTVAESAFLGDYSLTDADHGTIVTVEVADGVRTIRANALPDHTTGDFPNPGNPNSIAAQALSFDFPTVPIYTGSSTDARVPGVAVNGVPFEPGTREVVRCGSGPAYRIEAVQDRFDLGLDHNHAHVQPDGTYHYHGLPEALVASASAAGGDPVEGTDLVHVGFAADGHLIYVSPSGRYRPSWRLDTETRTSSGCSYRDQPVDVEATTPDGTYASDWVFDRDVGNLDRCNGTTIDDEYLYVLTEQYPFVPRCLNGAFTPRPGADDAWPPSTGDGGAGAGEGDGDGEGGAGA